MTRTVVTLLWAFIFTAFSTQIPGQTNNAFLIADSLVKGITLQAEGSAQSYYKLTTSNGLIVAVYDAKKGCVDYVFPHIFATIDSATYVDPFMGNVFLDTGEIPLETGYQENTHVIKVQYPSFSVRYFASFIRGDKVFYIAIKGKREQVDKIKWRGEHGAGKTLSGNTQLCNPLQDLPVRLHGTLIKGTTTLCLDKGVVEKYFLFSLTDANHTDTAIISKAVSALTKDGSSLADEEVNFMKRVFKRCRIPANLTPLERNVVEQSISVFKMSQVSDNEVFPLSHGQILASLRPGLWHVSWVRDGSYAIQAMTRLGMFDESRKALQFMLCAKAGKYRSYKYTDGKVYGPGVDYQISLTRYYGNGEEECDYNEYGPNIEYDDFGLFLIAYSDYIDRSGDTAFFRRWNTLVGEKVADVTIHCIGPDSLIMADSGPWEHHLQKTRHYTFTSAVCARGLFQYAQLHKKFGLPGEKYAMAAQRVKKGIVSHMLRREGYFMGNSTDTAQSEHEHFDAGVYELFANGLMTDKALFASHLKGCNRALHIPGDRQGYIRLNSNDPYENQEWVFINLRIANACLLFGERDQAATLINHVTFQASHNFNTVPEMYSNKDQMTRVPANFYNWNIWCNCIRQESNQYIGAIPMVGYGSGAYILALYRFYGW